MKSAREALKLLALFGAIYAVVVLLCWRLDLYAQVERAAARVTDAALGLTERAGIERSLAMERQGDAWVYRYHVRRGTQSQQIEGPYHAHAFNLFVYLALVLATPGAGWRRLLTALAAGGALIFAIDVGMLMNDLQSSERSLFPDASGPFPAPIALIGGLHDTAGAGILPVVLWTFLLAGPALARARASPDARALQPGDDRADASAGQ